jgi:hypothetical protein
MAFSKKLNSRNYYKIYLLGLTIPPTIRALVIKQWLSGHSRDQIAKDNQIGAGTVSSIVKQHKGEQQDYDNDSDYKFDLTRELAVKLNKEGKDVRSFAPAVRLQSKLEERGLNEEQIDSLIENIDVHCLKRGLKPEEFVNTIDDVSALSDSLSVPVDKMPTYINQGRIEVEKINQEIKSAERRKIEALEDLDMTIEDLDEYVRNRPLADKLIETQRKLEVATRQRNYYMDLANSREIDKWWLEYDWSVSEYQIDSVSEKLGIPFDIDQLIHIIEELFFHPNDHIDIIRTLAAHTGILRQEEQDRPLLAPFPPPFPPH